MAHLITNRDNVLFFKKPAWHKLGEVTGENITKHDLHKRFGWPVIKEPLFTARGEETSTYATIRTIYDDAGNEVERIILGDKLSASYEVLQNADLITAAEPLMDAGCIVETAGTLNKGRRVWLLLRLQGDMHLGADETITRFIMISNDHTGKESARVGFVPIRVVCANTLSMAESSRASSLIKIRHEGNVKRSMDFVVSLIDSANGQFLAYGEQLEQLMTMPIDQQTLDDYVKRIFFPKFEQQTANAETTEEKESARKDADRLLKLQNVISEIYQTETSIIDQRDANGTLYGAYQAVNHYLNHVQAIGEERRLHNIGWGTGRQTDLKALSVAKELVAAR